MANPVDIQASDFTAGDDELENPGEEETFSFGGPDDDRSQCIINS